MDLDVLCTPLTYLSYYPALLLAPVRVCLCCTADIVDVVMLMFDLFVSVLKSAEHSELCVEPPLVGLKLAQLLHEALVRLRLLPLRLAELERVFHAQVEPAHDVHYESGRAARLAHGAVDKYAIAPRLVRLIACELVTVLHYFAEMKLLRVHFQFRHVRLVVEQDGGS